MRIECSSTSAVKTLSIKFSFIVHKHCMRKSQKCKNIERLKKRADLKRGKAPYPKIVLLKVSNLKCHCWFKKKVLFQSSSLIMAETCFQFCVDKLVREIWSNHSNLNCQKDRLGKKDTSSTCLK